MTRVPFLLSLAACAAEHLAPPAERPDPQRVANDVELGFAADWTTTASGPIVEGATVRVTYDPARLTQCRGRKYGLEAWAINGAWRTNGGPVQYFQAYMPAYPADSFFVVPEAGTLELWFVNSDAFGCVAYDSDFGANYVFDVAPAVAEPDWIGNPVSAISRATCDDGRPCAGDLRPLDQGFVFDTWARQRAAIATVMFQVWEPGVTDWDDPSLWEALDARAYWRFSGEEDFRWDWVDFDGRIGNDARYALPLRSIDPLPGATIVDPAQCPSFALTVTPDGNYVETGVELYFEVNGAELRPSPAEGVYTGIFRDYVGLYTPCLGG